MPRYLFTTNADPEHSRVCEGRSYTNPVMNPALSHDVQKDMTNNFRNAVCVHFNTANNFGSCPRTEDEHVALPVQRRELFKGTSGDTMLAHILISTHFMTRLFE
eukprot:5680947-Amphidinium_carterae.1